MFAFLCMYMYAEPAVYEDPDIEVLDNINQTQFALIEHSKVHNCKWDTDDLGEDDFNETEPDDISFSIENWLFQVHPLTGVPRWFPRHEFPRQTIRNQFQVTNDENNGFFSFTQTTKSLAKIQFPISIVVLKKQTENLKILYTSSFLSFVPEILGFSGENATKEFCRRWNVRTDEIVKADNLTSCPCTLESARMNPNLDVDFTCSATNRDCHENVNAHRCFIISINGM